MTPRHDGGSSNADKPVQEPLPELPLPALPPALSQTVASGDVDAFVKQLAESRQGAGLSACSALEQAHVALQLGLIEQGDALVLEADALRPDWGIVPDRWGLWPTASKQRSKDDEAERKRCLQLVDDYLCLRHTPALVIWHSWLEPVQELWQRAAEPRQVSLMGLLLGRVEELPAPLEPAIEQLVGEAQVAADPSAALAVWAPLSRRLPQWAYARLKAADLSLQLKDLKSCAEHLGSATFEQTQLPWLCDIEARLAMANDQPHQAIRSWEKALRLAGSSGDQELAELFRQRRREAEWMLNTPVLSSSASDQTLEAFAEKLDTWAKRGGVRLSGSIASGEADPEEFAAFLDQASGRLALAG